MHPLQTRGLDCRKVTISTEFTSFGMSRQTLIDEFTVSLNIINKGFENIDKEMLDFKDNFANSMLQQLSA